LISQVKKIGGLCKYVGELYLILDVLFTLSLVSSSLSSSEKKLLKVYGGGIEAAAVDALLNSHHASGVFDPLTGVKIAVQGGKPVATQM
jgi:hypothetical protein